MVIVYLLSSVAIVVFSWEVLLSTVTSMQVSYAKNVNDSIVDTCDREPPNKRFAWSFFQNEKSSSTYGVKGR